MNEGSFYKYRGRMRVVPPNDTTGPCVACSGCNGLSRRPYRYRHHGAWVYLQLPCYSCDRDKYLLEKKKYPPVEETDRWVSISPEAQVARFFDQLGAGALSAEQSANPPDEDVVEGLDEP